MPDEAAPASGAWTPAPAPPPARAGRGRAGIIAAVLAVLVLVGAVGTWALRQSAAAGDGAGSPEAAAEQLVNALAARDTGQVAGLVGGEERRLVQVYGDRLTSLLDSRLGKLGGPGQGGKAALAVTDVRFRQVAGSGDTALVELSGGTFSAGGVKLGAAQVNQRLAAATEGKLDAVRLVARRDGGRWRVSVMASMADAALSAAGAAPADPAGLFTGPTVAGAADPEAAVAAVIDKLQAGDASGAVTRLAPDEARLLGGVRAAAARSPAATKGGGPGGDWAKGLLGGKLPGKGRLEDRRLSQSPIADGVVRVTVTGRVVVPGHQPEPLPADGVQVVVLREGNLWYPSLAFTAVEHALKG